MTRDQNPLPVPKFELNLRTFLIVGGKRSKASQKSGQCRQAISQHRAFPSLSLRCSNLQSSFL